MSSTSRARPADILSRIKAAGAVHADEDAFRIVRLEHGKPRYGEDISEGYLAQEANQTDALHFHKGCYLGQEIVEFISARSISDGSGSRLRRQPFLPVP